jgi:quercetin dioxygenase-like cupin family protein
MDISKGPADVRSALFGGEGTVRVWDLLRGTPALPFSAVLSCELEPRGSVGAHKQQRDPEIVIGVGGHGSAEIDGNERPLGPGDLVYLPHGATLSLKNLSSEESFRYLIVKATAGDRR